MLNLEHRYQINYFQLLRDQIKIEPTYKFIYNTFTFKLQIMKERPLRIFLDAQNISKHLECPICRSVFDNPNRMGCGHTFCYLCIEEWAIRSKLCPICKKSLRNRKPEKDLIAASMIDDLQAKCSHQDCTWTGVYSILKKHMRSCQYRERKTLQSNYLNNLVQLNDDQEVKQSVQSSKKGKKKIKQEFGIQNLPTFPSSQEQESPQRNLNTNSIGSNLQGMTFTMNSSFTNNRNSSVNKQIGSMRNKDSNSNSHSSKRSSSSEYLDIRPENLMLNRSLRNEENGILCQNFRNSSDVASDQRPTLSSELRNISFEEFQNDRQINLQSSHQNLQNQSEKHENSHLRITQPRSYNLWDGRKRKKKNSDSSSSNSSNLSSNPFDEPIVLHKNLVIVLDSESQCDSQKMQRYSLRQQKQSGQIPFYTIPLMSENKERAYGLKDAQKQICSEQQQNLIIQKQIHQLTTNSSVQQYQQRRSRRLKFSSKSPIRE